MTANPPERHDLGDSLALRWAGADDAERVAQFNAQVFRNAADDPPDQWALTQTREYMVLGHPLLAATDFALVEDTATGAVVASTCLMRQIWDYDGVAFDVGRPELVGTDPAYRNRGLVRALFAALHERSAARGQPVQAITGIPYFYRQFGYEYALDVDGGRVAYLDSLPEAKEGEPEAYALRPATPDDLPFIMALYDRRRAGLHVSTVIPQEVWGTAFDQCDPAYRTAWRLLVIVDAAGATCGYVRVSSRRGGQFLPVWDFAVREGLSPRTVAPPVLRALRDIAAATPVWQRERPLRGLALLLGREHPLYAALGPTVLPRDFPPYAWYVRVADLPAFLRRLAPALERRLAASPEAGYSGELKLDFYRDGLRLTFADGRLTDAAPWRRPVWGEDAQAGFPPLVFLQLLFGYRGLAELRAAYPDVTAEAEGAALLDILFPQRLSWVPYLE
ncbi:MAG TPA: GNAT family N-acetyltransferase [Thermomicrobiales bacterium]|nr:GNAT family N-acetyltransferase [Thermomicrobiales bacterium]